MKKYKKIKLVAKTDADRIGSLIVSAVLISALVTLISLGYLNFGETLVITLASIVASVAIIVPMLIVNLGAHIVFDVNTGKITLCQYGIKKKEYCLECVSKLSVEPKTIDVHVVSDVDEQKVKCGSGCIKQTSYKKVHYKMSSYKNPQQRRRYEQFASKCNKLLDEVIHKKVIRQVHRVSIPTE